MHQGVARSSLSFGTHAWPDSGYSTQVLSLTTTLALALTQMVPSKIGTSPPGTSYVSPAARSISILPLTTSLKLNFDSLSLPPSLSLSLLTSSGIPTQVYLADFGLSRETSNGVYIRSAMIYSRPERRYPVSSNPPTSLNSSPLLDSDADFAHRVSLALC